MTLPPTDDRPPLVSIVTPLYNRAWCIAECIESANLKGARAELVIVDDGSSDGSVGIARETVARLGLEGQVRIFEQPNAGPSVARNRAAQEARGEWLAFLDSDDLWLPWTLATLIPVLEALAPEVELLFLNGQNFAQEDELSGLAPETARTAVSGSFVEAVSSHPRARYGACNAVMRKSAFAGLGGFSPELRCAEDTDLFLRTRGQVGLVLAPVMAGLRRSGHESLTGNAVEVVRGFEWMQRVQREGGYVGAPEDLESFLAGSCVYSIRAAFASGKPGLAYRLYLNNIGLLKNPRSRRMLPRLPMTPVLHLWRPQAYPFRLRP